MAGKRTKGVDLGLDKDSDYKVTGTPPGEIDGSMNQGIANPVKEADIDPAGGTQSGQHPVKSQPKVMRFYG